MRWVTLRNIGVEDKCNSGLVGNIKGRNHLEGLDLDWRMILK